MITMTRYIDDAKKKLGIKTTTKLAQLIGAQGNYLLRVYHQETTCNDAVAIRLAELINEEPEKALVIANYTTAADHIKPYYEMMLKAVENQKRNQKKVKPSN